jgi:hypothetical protein
VLVTCYCHIAVHGATFEAVRLWFVVTLRSCNVGSVADGLGSDSLVGSLPVMSRFKLYR